MEIQTERTAKSNDIVDLFIIGGGINGCGIARDAAGRGYSVCLAEMNDLASATSSASTKLFHGGLRYLEYFEWRLVREALIERETLLRAMPHISWPMRFVLPLNEDMRFEPTTPASRIVAGLFPWLRGRRPGWMIRFGLELYDRLGSRHILPGTSSVDLTSDPVGKPLKPGMRKAFEYSDCWVDDARLVSLNARDAALRGATIMTRAKVKSAQVRDGVWCADVQTGAGPVTVRAKMLVNAAGPWAGEVIRNVARLDTRETVRLVRGSHIVTRRLFDHDKCYFFQGDDGRIVFAIPYESDFTLIGTTDVDHAGPDMPAVCTREELDYLCRFVSRYLATPVEPTDVVWSYSGVRPLYDDGQESATAATRDYTLKIDRSAGAPVLNVFGGKITTFRRLAEAAMRYIDESFKRSTLPWTADQPLPGGDFAIGGSGQLAAELLKQHPFLNDKWALRLVRCYGKDAMEMLTGARSLSDLGIHFGENLTEREVIWLMTHEFASCADDVLWRRTKLGLRLDPVSAGALERWIADYRRSNSGPM